MSSSFMSHSLITRNVQNMVTGEKGAVVRVNKHHIATVLLAETGKLSQVHCAHLMRLRGRPIKLVNGLVRADVDELIQSSPLFRHAAIIEMFSRQTDDERDCKATRHDNKNGFRSDSARRGTELALLPLDAWTDACHMMAIDVLSYYSGTQLWDLASRFLTDVIDSDDATESNALISEILADSGAFPALPGLTENDPFALELASIQANMA